MLVNKHENRRENRHENKHENKHENRHQFKRGFKHHFMHDFKAGCKHIPGQTALQIFIQITVPGKSSIEYSQIICSVYD